MAVSPVRREGFVKVAKRKRSELSQQRPLTLFGAQKLRRPDDDRVMSADGSTESSSSGSIDAGRRSIGMTRILEHVYIGCQFDVTNLSSIHRHGITHVLNVSQMDQKPLWLDPQLDGAVNAKEDAKSMEQRYLCIPINDGYNVNIRDYFHQCWDFLDDVSRNGGRCLVHCFAGISRSPTIVISYLMMRRNISMRKAYDCVKGLRPTVSPNFNFLGQLMELEKKLGIPPYTSEEACTPAKMCKSPDSHQPTTAARSADAACRPSSLTVKATNTNTDTGSLSLLQSCTHSAAPVPVSKHQLRPCGAVKCKPLSPSSPLSELKLRSDSSSSTPEDKLSGASVSGGGGGGGGGDRPRSPSGFSASTDADDECRKKSKISKLRKPIRPDSLTLPCPRSSFHLPLKRPSPCSLEEDRPVKAFGFKTQKF